MNSGYESVNLLLDAGSDVNARSNDGTTALMLAAGGYGAVDILKLLINRGANPNLKNKKGETALSIAKEQHRPDRVAFLRSVTSLH
jgi:ankyrin repeat protein